VRRVAHIEPHSAEWSVAGGVRREVPPHFFLVAALVGIEAQNLGALDHGVEQKLGEGEVDEAPSARALIIEKAL